MNKKTVIYILGCVLVFVSAFMLLPWFVSLIYSEETGKYFLYTAIAGFVIGRIMTWKKPEKGGFFAKEGFVSVALSWIVLSVVGAIPLWLSGEIPNFVDALFEIVSGFTTTGASIAENVEAFSHTALFWRSFSHWRYGCTGVYDGDPAVSRWREYAYPASRKSGTDRIQTGAAYA